MRASLVVLLALLLGCAPDEAPPARIAVAANFARTAEDLREAFTAAGGAPLDLVIGSTGGLHAQITAGAPFDAFLAADTDRPDRLIEAGLADPGSRSVYAVGRLVLWSASIDLDRAADPAEELRRRNSHRIAIADPVTAPYGAAARAYLQGAGLLDAVAGRLVTAQSVGQAHQFTASGNAELGLLAASQIEAGDGGAAIAIPESAYPPLEQAAVALTDHAGARAFLDFVRRDSIAHAIIARHGYRLPSSETTPHADRR